MTSDPNPVQAPSAFHVMLKPRGAICNLACEYCFFLSKEAFDAIKDDIGEEARQEILRRIAEDYGE